MVIFRKILYDKLHYSINYDNFKLDDTNDLMFSLAGHKLNVPWKLNNIWGADVSTIQQIQIIKKYI